MQISISTVSLCASSFQIAKWISAKFLKALSLILDTFIADGCQATGMTCHSCWNAHQV